MKRAALLLATALFACAPKPPATPVLRVCADPNNLPFSNRAGQGFENALAALIAHDLHAELRYLWWAQRRGNLRETIKAGKCDLVPGIGATMEAVTTSRPWYRSTYTIVTRAADPLADLTGFDDPRLKRLRLGVQLIGDDGVNTPPAHALMKRGLVQNVRGFMVQGDYRRAWPQDAILDALADKQVDVAFVWGPVAGDYARRHAGQVRVTPVRPAFDGPGLPMVYDVSVGVRKGDVRLQQLVDDILIRRSAEIVRLLQRHGVPLVAG